MFSAGFYLLTATMRGYRVRACLDAYSSTIELLGELGHLLGERSKTGNNSFSHNEIDNEDIGGGAVWMDP